VKGDEDANRQGGVPSLFAGVELYAQGLKHSLVLLVDKTLSAAQTSSPSINPYYVFHQSGVKGSG
jgi:hypothetical protein